MEVSNNSVSNTENTQVETEECMVLSNEQIVPGGLESGTRTRKPTEKGLNIKENKPIGK